MKARLAFAVLAALTTAAPAQETALSEGDAGAVRCAAAALLAYDTFELMTEAGADLSGELQGVLGQAAIDLLEAAQPLFQDGQGGNAAMTAQVDGLAAERDLAMDGGTLSDWLPDLVDEVRVCHLAVLNAPGSEQ